MSGPAISLLTVIVIFGFVLIIALIDVLLGWVTRTFTNGSGWTKVLLAIPLVIMLVFSFITGIFAFACGLFAFFVIATGARNWWHKGMK